MMNIVDSMTYDRLEVGKGGIRSQKLKRQPVQDLVKGANPFVLNEPNVGEEVYLIDKYKVIPITTFPMLARDLGLSNDQIARYLSSVDALLEETKDMYLYDECIDLFNSWTPRTTQQGFIQQVTSTNTMEQNVLNAQAIAKDLFNVLVRMQRPTGDYMDITTYTVGSQSVTGLEAIMTSRDQFKVYLNSRYQANLVVDAYSTLFGASEVRDIIGSFITVPEDDLADDTMIYRLAHNDKFAMSYFYDVGMAIQNPADTGIYSYRHFSYGNGVFQLAQAYQANAVIS